MVELKQYFSTVAHTGSLCLLNTAQDFLDSSRETQNESWKAKPS